ncbi:hypothetical protein BsWGS_27333 [Bradybaena similaris]
MLLFGTLLAILVITSTLAQSVVQECLTEQIRVNQNSSIQIPQNITAEATTIEAFHSICSHYMEYVKCFLTRSHPSDHPADRFLRLLFSPSDLHLAYRGLCTLDLDILQLNIRCLLSTPEVRRCYSNFNQGISKVVNLERQKKLPRSTVQELACNVSVTRYLCETDVYASCDARIGKIMQDFFFAGLPATCRTAAGVSSRYVSTINGSDERYGCRHLLIILAGLIIYF